jgi:predicted regulator of Ras-like GTPase activity (Roadblock/LC7/MglB family)
MKHVLQRLGTVPHLLASAFFDASGDCLATHSTDIVREQSLSTLGPQLAQLASRTARNLTGSQTMIFGFAGGVVVVRRARDYFLAVLCEPDSGTLRALAASKPGSVDHVESPHKKAYKQIDDFEKRLLQDKPEIVILSCGMTATCLANRLSRRGVQAIDFGSGGSFIAKLLDEAA